MLYMLEMCIVEGTMFQMYLITTLKLLPLDCFLFDYVRPVVCMRYSLV